MCGLSRSISGCFSAKLGPGVPTRLSSRKVAVSSVQQTSLQLDQPTISFHEMPQWRQYEMLNNTDEPVPGIRVGAEPKELGVAWELRLRL